MAEVASENYGLRQKIGLFLGPLLFVVVLLLPNPDGMNDASLRAAAIALLMAVWWVSEALPLAATSFIPLALYPLFSVLDFSSTAARYADSNIFLFMGGFFIAMAMQKWNLHKRIALMLIARIGGGLFRTLAGFMIATWFLSMWVSNTATTVMMLPIALAVISQLKCGSHQRTVGLVLMLGIAYAANVGGIATPIGTGPNAVFLGQAESLFPELPPISFANWFIFAMPISLGFLIIIWLYLSFVARKAKVGAADKNAIRGELAALGPWSVGERRVLIITCLTALAWIWRRDISIGELVIPGWSSIFGLTGTHDGTVAMIASLLLFATPASFKKGEFLLDWAWAKKIPWDVLILLGGGFALAESFKETGLASYIGEHMLALQHIPLPLLILMLCLSVTFLTELTSNTATTTMMLPILGATAQTLGIHPYLLMLPVTVSASCAFMMPVATPPNAIVFGSGYISIPQMVRTGFLLSVFGAFWITAATYFVIIPALDLPLP